MKLLEKTQAQSKLKRDNDELIESNLRLRHFERDITKRLNAAKESYEPEKMKALGDFEAFSKDLQAKKSKLLMELAGIQQLIEQKKELYYGLIARQDALQEKAYQIQEANRKLDLRQTFVEDLERKWNQQQ